MLMIEKTYLTNLMILTPERLSDQRGWFCETWNQACLVEAGIDVNFVQDNHSYSFDIGTLRGLHCQAPPRAQDKLVRCVRGSIFDVAVDARKGSPTFGHWLGEELSADNGRQLFVPKGFLHGFVTLEPNTEVLYKVSDHYDPRCDVSVRWDSLAIDWRLTSDPILSRKDIHAPPFEEWVSPFTYEEKQ